MGFELTTTATLLSRETQVEPQIVIKIDGVDLIFGTDPVTTVIKYGDDGLEYGQANTFYGGLIVDPNSRDYISIKGKTTKQITQQIIQDQGGTSSISNFNIELVDKNGEVSSALTPDTELGDILTRNCQISLGFEGSNYPDDFIIIFQGIVQEARYGQGNIVLKISHPDELKRQDIYTKIDTELSAAIDDTVTTIPLASVTGLIQTSDTLTSYIRIEDELIEVVDINTTTNELENAARGALGTTAVAHADEDAAETFYTLSGNSIDLALKLMLSGGPTFYLVDSVTNFVRINSIDIVNAVQFESYDLVQEHGVAVGDLLSTTGAANAENNFTDRTIINIVPLGTSTYIVVDGDPLVIEENTAGSASFKTQWNTLPDGLAMLPKNVDVARHLAFQDTFTANFPDYLFYLRDTITAKDFLEKEIYYPAGLYALPRKGRASLGFTNPPLSVESVPTLDENNITNLSKLSVTRATSRNFYNAIVYRFNEQLLEEKFLAGEILLSAESNNRIQNIKNRPLKLESKGLRTNAASINIINRLQDRMIDRYKFAASRIDKMELLYKDGFNIEAGDIVVFRGENTNLKDPDTGLPLPTRLYEVINKSLNIIAGKVTLDILDTAFDINAKFGVVSPSSILKDASSSTQLFLDKSFGTLPAESEVDKWSQYIGIKILVHNADFSVSGETTITAIDPILPDTLNVNPALGFTPDSTYTIEIADYDESSLEAQSTAKNNFAFVNGYTDVTSGTDGFIFDVTSVANAFVGQTVKVHSLDFTDVSDETTITDITSLTITVEDDLGFTPSSGNIVELLGFDDGNPAYRII